MALNKVILMGRLTADPELKKTQSDLSVISFTLAVDRNYGKGDERQTDFINCIAWRQTAEFISRYFSKGQMIAVEGSLQTRSYEDKQGNKRSVTEVLCEHVFFAGSKGSGTSQQNTSYAPPQGQNLDAERDDFAPPFQPQYKQNEFYDIEAEGEEDLPF